MKTNLLTLLIAVAAINISQAQTNAITETNRTFTVEAISPDAVVKTNLPADYNKIDLTLGGAGTSFHGQNEFGLDASFSIDPFQKLPSLWVGASQSVYWQPSILASTDIDADWNTQIYKNLYINSGWSAGSIYGKGGPGYRTGPEAIFQYYTTDNSYIYFGVNYDLITNQQTDSNNSSGDGWRYSFGIGIEW